jgi:hypothetical protein
MVMSVVNVSAWVDGYPIGPSGILASIGVAWDYVDMCGWVVCGICVFRMFASMVVRTWPPASWVGSLAGGCLASLFLGVISWGFFSSRAWWAPMLGLDSRGLMNSNEGVTTRTVNSGTGHVVRDT